MEAFWYCALAFMLVMYAVLDGFDLGAGAVSLFATKSPKERSLVLKAIGPYWDGNEVWLIAAGGVLFLAFPTVYAAAFSGFYLPFMVVLWLLALRAISIELRHHSESFLWQGFWDKVFALSSLTLTVVLGAAIGNLIRGIPLDQHGNFFEPFWTSFFITPYSGVLDWFTVLFGLLSCAALSLHGALFIGVKTDGILHARCCALAKKLFVLVLTLAVLAIVAVIFVQPTLFHNFYSKPWGLLFPAIAIGSLAFLGVSLYREHLVKAFVSSCLVIVFSTATVAFGIFPHLILSSLNPTYSLTAYNALVGGGSLDAAIYWWPIGILLCLCSFGLLYFTHRGKVTGEH